MADADDGDCALSGPPPKFGRHLASSDKETRDKAVKAVTRYLKNAHDITALELFKVWKALFYCMWHSDKRAVQADLAERLTGLIHVMPPASQPLFVQVFWGTMSREWHGIDRLRLDKFYMLMRLALGHMLQALCDSGLDLATVQQFAAVMRDGPLSPRAPRGIHFFLVDNYLGALRKTLPDGTAGETWAALVEPFFQLMGQVEEGHLLRRVTEQVVVPLLHANSPTDKSAGAEREEGEEGEEEAGLSALPYLLPELSDRLFDLASDPSTREENRSDLYNLQRTAEGLAGAAADKGGAKADAAAVSGVAGKPARRRAGTAQPKPARVRSAVQAQAPAALTQPASQAAETQEALRGMISKAVRNAERKAPEPAPAAEGQRLKRAKRPAAPGEAEAVDASESTLHHAAASKARKTSAQAEIGATAAAGVKASSKAASRAARTADHEADQAEAAEKKKRPRREAGAEPIAARARSTRRSAK